MWSKSHRPAGWSTRGTQGAAGPPPAWSPLQLSGLLVWLRADLGVTPGVGAGVQQWNNQSGAVDPNRNFRQLTAALQPTFLASDPAMNGLPSISSDDLGAIGTGGSGGAQKLENPGNWSIGAGTVFTAYMTLVAPRGNQIFYPFSYPGVPTMRSLHTGGQCQISHTGYSATGGNLTIPSALILQINGTVGQIYQNAQTQVVTDTGSLGNVLTQLMLLNISAAPYGGMKMNEIAICSGVATPADRLSYLTYGCARVGVPVGP